MSKNVLAALQILGRSTRWYFRVWDTAGPSGAKARAVMMTLLTGVKTPQSKAGVNALQSEFIRAAGLEGECFSSREDRFHDWAAQQLANDPEYVAELEVRRVRKERLDAVRAEIAAERAAA